MEPPAPKLPPKPVREQAKVIYAYEAQNDDELSIREGDIINVISKEIEDQGWYKGELNGKVGVFPDNFVELIKVPVPLDEDKPLPPKPKGGLSSGSPASKGSPASGGAAGGKAEVVSNGTKSSTESSNVAAKSSIFGAAKKMVRGVSASSITTNPSKPAVVGAVSSSNKPDVVPHEISTLATSKSVDVETKESVTDLDGNSFSAIESTGISKLHHPTASRPKGPNNRRPPSYISVQKENDVPGLENGDSKHGPDSSLISNNNNKTGNGIQATEPQKVVSPLTQKKDKEGEQPPAPWILELRKTQEAKRQFGKDVPTPTEPSGGDAPTVPNVPPKDLAINSGTKQSPSHPLTTARTSPNRVSGDFSKFGALKSQTSQDSTSGDEKGPNPVSILNRPTKPLNKPSATAASSVVNSVPSLSSPTSSPVASSLSSPATNSTPANKSASMTSSASKFASPCVPAAESDPVSNQLVSELQKDMKTLKETVVPRKDFEDMLRQVGFLISCHDSMSQLIQYVIHEY